MNTTPYTIHEDYNDALCTAAAAKTSAQITQIRSREVGTENVSVRYAVAETGRRQIVVDAVMAKFEKDLSGVAVPSPTSVNTEFSRVLSVIFCNIDNQVVEVGAVVWKDSKADTRLLRS